MMIDMWEETEQGLYKRFEFTDFEAAWGFMTQVAAVANQMNHHPRWENEWNVVQIWLSSHEQGGAVTNKDRQLATAIDNVLNKSVTIVKKNRVVKVFTDGGSRGNPGPSASAYVILDSNEEIIENQGIYIGITTNNVAEYTALKYALEACVQLQAREVEIYMDSLLVINQMKQTFKIKNRDLWPIHDAIKELLPKFKQVTFTHVPREMNTLADAAVNRTLDAELKSK